MPALGWVISLGGAVGFLAGMFGVGGGFLITPLLAVLFGVPVPVAAGTGLCQIIGTALVSLLRHRRLHNGEVRFDLLMLVGSLCGVDAGARVLGALERSGSWRGVPLVHVVVATTYIVVLLGAAALFWVEGGHPRVRAPLARLRLGPAIALPVVGVSVSAVLVAWIGAALGFLSGLLGIGGGVALMPVLVYGYGFPMQHAAGTGILVILITAVYGTLVNALAGRVDLPLALWLLVSAVPAAQLGALATARLPGATLRRVFAGVVLLTAAVVAWDLARRFA
jgi:uncharacterized membrane protein YfcA